MSREQPSRLPLAYLASKLDCLEFHVNICRNVIEEEGYIGAKNLIIRRNEVSSNIDTQILECAYNIDQGFMPWDVKTLRAVEKLFQLAHNGNNLNFGSKCDDKNSGTLKGTITISFSTLENLDQITDKNVDWNELSKKWYKTYVTIFNDSKKKSQVEYKTSTITFNKFICFVLWLVFVCGILAHIFRI